MARALSAWAQSTKQYMRSHPTAKKFPKKGSSGYRAIKKMASSLKRRGGSCRRSCKKKRSSKSKRKCSVKCTRKYGKKSRKSSRRSRRRSSRRSSRRSRRRR